MVTHTGSAEQRADDYFDPALNRTARLLAAGHGGQILISGVTADLVREVCQPTRRCKAWASIASETLASRSASSK
jgi:class 3 adenylate cyclase